ncbi:Proton pump interactor 1 isoform 2 [Hibiscus syriacus]|uniref:Proton pump interactor 1 isoform 2 n=1 Tax=Hibiscus syriacus TaxID=106335 RepID=A0A6A3BC80_HIBSY|nr:Proton pump interactor 1 isoform 2 [Hibiscus syriacus]
MGVEVVEPDMALLSVDKEPDKGENNASNVIFPKDAVDEWPAPKQIHSFHFIRYRLYEDLAIKVKIEQADKEVQKWNKARFKLTEELKVKRRNQTTRGNPEQVVAIAAMRSKIEDSLGQKEDIQDQVKLMGVDLNGVKEEQQAIWSKKRQIKDKLDAIENKIESLQKELEAVTQKRDEAYGNIQDLRKERDEGNAPFYQSRSAVNRAKLLAAEKDIKALEEFSTAEVEKFMALWNGKKAFRDDYEKRILPSLDSRLLSRDGRIRNPDEKPLVAPEKPVQSEKDTILRPSVRQQKEETKSGPQPDSKHPKKVSKDGETKIMEIKSSLEYSGVAEEISGSGKFQKDTSADKEVDEEEEREKKVKKKAAAYPEESPEAVAQDSETEKVDVITDAPVSVKDKVPKENTARYRNRNKGLESLPRAILKRRKSANYWIWAAPAATLVPILLAMSYYILRAAIVTLAAVIKIVDNIRANSTTATLPELASVPAFSTVILITENISTMRLAAVQYVGPVVHRNAVAYVLIGVGFTMCTFPDLIFLRDNKRMTEHVFFLFVEVCDFKWEGCLRMKG